MNLNWIKAFYIDDSFITDPEQDKAFRFPCFASLCGLISGLLLHQAIKISFNPSSPLIQLLLSLMPFQILGLFLGLCFMYPLQKQFGFRKAFDFPEHNESAKIMLNESWKMLLIIYPSIFIVNFISTFLCEAAGIKLQPQALEMLGNSDSGWLFWSISGFSAVILAPIAEEILFRILIYRTIRSFCPIWAAAVTSLFFAMMHGHPQFLAGLFIIGMGLQKARQAGGIPRAILLHSIYNLVAFISILIKVFTD